MGKDWETGNILKNHSILPWLSIKDLRSLSQFKKQLEMIFVPYLITKFYNRNEMFSDIKPETLKMWLWKRSSIKVVLREINYTRNPTAIKVLHLSLPVPSTKPQVRKSMQFVVKKLKTLSTVFPSNHTNKTTTQFEKNATFLISKEKRWINE